jgi:hypothetical protein
MQAADLGDSHDGTERRRFNAPRDRSIPLQREMRTRDIVVVDVFAEDLSEMILAEDDQVVPAFAPDRSDDSLGVGVLPGGMRGRDDLLDAQSRHPVTEPIAVDGVTISEQTSGLGPFCREGFDDLLGGPFRRGVSGDVDVQDASPVMGQDEDTEEQEDDSEDGHRDLPGRTFLTA